MLYASPSCLWISLHSLVVGADSLGNRAKRTMPPPIPSPTFSHNNTISQASLLRLLILASWKIEVT
ncbi:hypothetical protein CC78DRAFT_602415 [Lojkania enalia]|uniref:Secreted protein n=1 Tax=Lojkania enalia TaxID=147567 RepID=A0A9P4KAN7_9PLEO|nr:hypothetical protein CC78DRAFT_602415 [Didymosphaeria enalia]